MFNNRDALFGRKDDLAQKDSKSATSPFAKSALAAAPAAAATPTPAPAAPAATTPAPASDDAKGSRLIVGPDIKLKGVEITDCDTLVVEGRVEASMDSRIIQIAEGGVYSGAVGIDVAEIRGRFEGELTARKQLVIHSTGRVSGKIRYGKITVEEGGELSGDVSTLAGNGDKSPARAGSSDTLAAKHKAPEKSAGAAAY